MQGHQRTTSITHENRYLGIYIVRQGVSRPLTQTFLKKWLKSLPNKTMSRYADRKWSYNPWIFHLPLESGNLIFTRSIKLFVRLFGDRISLIVPLFFICWTFANRLFAFLLTDRLFYEMQFLEGDKVTTWIVTSANRILTIL
jgi:hypothetical protein